MAAVMRRDAEKAADDAHRHGIQKWYSNASELINDPDVNATTSKPRRIPTRVNGSGQCAQVNLCTSRTDGTEFSECEEMLAVSGQTGMPVWVAYYRRALPAFLEAKRMVEAGEIGKPLTVNINLFQQAAERPWRKKK